jgi:hypothetical protein
MIITRSHANRLVRTGKATKDGSTTDNDQRYQIVVRHDLQRVDHYPLSFGQLAEIQVRADDPTI